MGYRSEVASLIYGDGTKEDNDKVAALWMAANMRGLLPKNGDDFGPRLITIPGNDPSWSFTAIYFHEEEIKWHRDFTWTRAWEEVMHMAMYTYGLNTELVRIGEDYNDIETESGGETLQHFLYVERNIGRDFKIEEDTNGQDD